MKPDYIVRFFHPLAGGRGASERAANGAPRCGAGWPLPRARGGGRGGAAAGGRAGGRENPIDPTK
jgi:hypothetical protein